MISVCAIQFDPEGRLTVTESPASETGSVSRRVARVATLDGLVSVNDGGYSDGDRDFRLIWQSDQATDDKVRRLIRIHGRVTVATREGVFEAVPERFDPGPPDSTLFLLVTKRLSE